MIGQKKIYLLFKYRLISLHKRKKIFSSPGIFKSVSLTGTLSPSPGIRFTAEFTTVLSEAWHEALQNFWVPKAQVSWNYGIRSCPQI